MNDLRTQTSPVQVSRTVRENKATLLTSLPAGKMVPLAAIPLLRMDAVQSGSFRFSFEMHETAEVLMNAVTVKVRAFLVPNLALERFDGVDALNRSHLGEQEADGNVIPYIETQPFGDGVTNEIYKYLGLHAPADQLVNTSYLEAYNAVWNHLAVNRSLNITKRNRLDIDLAPAFWAHQNHRHIVPSFDQALLDGEVALNVADGKMPVTGLGRRVDTPGVSYAGSYGPIKDASGALLDHTSAQWYDSDSNHTFMSVDPSNNLPAVFAELEQNGITVSLSNIELAKKTAAFANLRLAYEGLNDDSLIDLLMDGINIPNQDMKQPILLSEKTTVFGMSKRYATDGGSLSESAVNGATFIDMPIRTPLISHGGVVMIVAEIVPEQLFERQKDPYLFAQGVDDLPSYQSDELDPQKVVAVPNNYVDTDHSNPDSTFGYAPLNFEWNNTGTRVGGRYRRPEVDAPTDEDRQRIWAVETANPVLGEDFYLASNMHTKPFADTLSDSFECVVQGGCMISGLTVFGSVLREGTDAYDKTAEQVEDVVIVQN